MNEAKETTLGDGPFAGLMEQKAQFEEYVKTLSKEKGLLARCRYAIMLNEKFLNLTKREKVMLAVKTLEETRDIPINTICDFLVKHDVLEGISDGYVRQTLPDKYKNTNQGRIAKLQPRGRFRTAVRLENKAKESRKLAQALKHDII